MGGGEEAAARRDGAPPDRAIGAAARTQRRGGGGGRGRAALLRALDPHLRRRGRSSRVKVSAGVGRRAPADVRCLARQKSGARPGRVRVWSGAQRGSPRRGRAQAGGQPMALVASRCTPTVGHQEDRASTDLVNARCRKEKNEKHDRSRRPSRTTGPAGRHAKTVAIPLILEPILERLPVPERFASRKKKFHAHQCRALGRAQICSERLIVASWPAGTSGEADHGQPSSPPEAAVAAISAGLVTAPPRQVRV